MQYSGWSSPISLPSLRSEEHTSELRDALPIWDELVGVVAVVAVEAAVYVLGVVSARVDDFQGAVSVSGAEGFVHDPFVAVLAVDGVGVGDAVFGVVFADLAAVAEIGRAHV